MTETTAVAAFHDAAKRGSAADAEAVLRDAPEIVDQHFEVAAMAGQADAVAAVLKDDPEAANRPVGPAGWAPLLYLGFSPIVGEGLLDCAQLLLDHGADPNARDPGSGKSDEGWTPLCGAVAVRRNMDLGRLLLEAGATPNDNESLYHAAEGTDLDGLRLLLEFGVDVNASPGLLRKLDYEDPAGARLLLEAGADPNLTFGIPGGVAALHHAVRRMRSAGIVGLLLDHGAEIDQRTAQGFTAYQIAVRLGRMDIAELLAARGADTTLSAVDRLIGACFCEDASAVQEILVGEPETAKALNDEDRAMLCVAAWFGRRNVVRLLLALGIPIDTRGMHGGTALHQAAFGGQLDVVDLLLGEGASVTQPCQAFEAPPLGWCVEGSRQGEFVEGRASPSDHAAVAERLIAAGAAVPEGGYGWGSPEVAAVLKEAVKAS